MRPITDILREYRNGRAVDTLTRDLAEIVRAVDETNKPGELTIIIKVEPDKGGGSGKEVSIKAKSKIPKVEIPKGVFFSDASGDLHRTDPAQSEMTFREADARGTA